MKEALHAWPQAGIAQVLLEQPNLQTGKPANDPINLYVESWLLKLWTG